MSVLKGKKILLAISGGIAAYKTAILTRLLIKAGAQVKIVMTPAAKDFVTPLTLSTLSKNPVYSEYYSKENENEVWNNHVEIALWADAIIVAPATANTLSKMANGTCDNLLLAVYLSAKSPVFIAPAMDFDMYKHGSTKENLDKLISFGNFIIPAESGELASGLSGEGRMAEPEHIVIFVENYWIKKMPLFGKKILITAGPTYEKIDPVRFIGNHSTGKMGYAIAEEAAKNGAEVILISGPSHLKVNNLSIKLEKVTTADEMYAKCNTHFSSCDIFIAAAAVADYKPEVFAPEKIKKQEDKFILPLTKTVDILGTLSQSKKKQFIIGFALETNNEIEHAILKIKKKNLDLIVLNSLQDKDAGFGFDTNKVTFIDKELKQESLPLLHKNEVAEKIIEKLVSHYNEQK